MLRIYMFVLVTMVAGTPLVASEQNHTTQGVAFLQTGAGLRKCPPPQPCDCHCNCPEIVWPAPPPSPLLPTPMPFFGLLQTSSKSEEKTDSTAAINQKSRMQDRQKGTVQALRGQALEVVAFQEADKQPPGF